MQLRGKQETMAKYHAFVAVCNFIKAFVTPAKTADQVFVALFRAASSDARRLLIREALDVLLPAAAEQVAQGGGEYGVGGGIVVVERVGGGEGWGGGDSVGGMYRM